MSDEHELIEVHDDYIKNVKDILRDEGLDDMWSYYTDNVNLYDKGTGKRDNLTDILRELLGLLLEDCGEVGKLFIEDNDVFMKNYDDVRTSLPPIVYSSESIKQSYSGDYQKRLNKLFSIINSSPEEMITWNLSSSMSIDYQDYIYIDKSIAESSFSLSSSNSISIWEIEDVDNITEFDFENYLEIIKNKEIVWSVMGKNRQKVKESIQHMQTIKRFIMENFGTLLVSKKL